MDKEPDIVISMKEGAINRALAASFTPTKARGLTALLVQGAADRWRRQGPEASDPPMVVMLDDGTTVATFGAEAWGMVLGVRLEADVSASARLGHGSRTIRRSWRSRIST